MGKDSTITWHPGFVNAMKLELIFNEEDLIYDTERELNQQPLRIDFLVIKKNKNTVIKNEIGHFFRGHNLMEYKSENDEMNIDTLFKTLGYGCLYKAYAKEVDSISEDDITLTLVRRRKPIKLFSYFEKRSIIIENKRKGIYLIRNRYIFPVQFVVLKELNEDTHVWLTSIMGNLEKKQIQKLLTAVQQLEKKSEKGYANAVMSVVTKANEGIFQKIKEEDTIMYGELLRLLKPDLDDEIDAAVLEKTESIIRRMLIKEKYEYEEIAEIAGTSVEKVKQMAEAELMLSR